MHLLGAPALTAEAEAELPVINRASPPQANVILALEGAGLDDLDVMPFVASSFANNPTAAVTSPMDGHVAGEVAERVNAGINVLGLDGYTMCLSADERVHDSALCQTAQDSLEWDSRGMLFHQPRSSAFSTADMVRHVPVPSSPDAPLIRAFEKAGGSARRNKDDHSWSLQAPTASEPATFDLEEEADRLLLQELNLACHVAASVSPDGKAGAAADRPDLYFLTSNGLPHLLDVHGEGSPKAQTALALVDAALNEVVGLLLEKYDDKVTATVLLDNSSPARPLHNQFRRFLADAPTPMPTGSMGNYTIEQIVEYNIGLWTGIVLVLILLSAICCMVNMDIQPDSLLYAKFQADTSSKLD